MLDASMDLCFFVTGNKRRYARLPTDYIAPNSKFRYW